MDDPLIEEILGQVSGLTLDQHQMTWLMQGINTTDLVLNLAEPDQVQRGAVEVGEEMVYVSSYEAAVANIAPFGRGYLNTVAATWPTNTRVTMSPRFPRAKIRSTMNDVIQSVYPKLFAVGETELDPDGIATTFELPVEAESVLTMTQRTFGSSGRWRTIDRYLTRDTSATGYPNKRSVDILQGLAIDQPVHVRYTKKPTTLTAGQAFSLSGLAPTAWPCIMYGTLHRLLAVAPAGLAGVESVQAGEAQTRRRQTLSDVANGYYALHIQLLQDERDRLLEEHDATAHFEE